MCSPSTSASVMIITLLYLKFCTLNWSPTPVPITVMIFTISSLERDFTGLAFSTFSIFPLRGRIACVSLLRAIFALLCTNTPEAKAKLCVLGTSIS